VKVGSRGYVVDGYVDVSRPSDGIIAVSTDGTNWQVTEMIESGVLWDVAFGDGRWLAVGSELVDNPETGNFEPVKAAFTAPTGGAWEPAADPPDRVNSIAYGAGRWVVAGDNGIAQAVDGATWTPVAETETLWWNPGVEFVLGHFVAFGEGPALLDSTDGVTWNFFDTQLTEVTDVAETEGRIVAHGYYDCCFGEEPGGQTSYTLTRNDDGTWTIAEDQ